jgi:hypothetical protein
MLFAKSNPTKIVESFFVFGSLIVNKLCYTSKLSFGLLGVKILLHGHFFVVNNKDQLDCD